MARRRDGLLSWALLGLLAGCQSSPLGQVMPAGPTTVAAMPALRLAPSVTLAWSVESSDPHTPSVSGEADIGPDGSFPVGPYGEIKLAGLTLEDAGRVLEQYMKQHVPAPRVSLQVVSAPPIRLENWQRPPATAAQPQVAPVSWQAPKPPPSLTEEMLSSATPDYHEDAMPAARMDSRWRPLNQAPRVMPVMMHEEPPADLKIQPRPLATESTTISGMVTHHLPPAPRENAKVTLPAYIVEPPDILMVESTQQLRDQPIRGQHLVRPDGTIGLGIYGSVYVAGLTLDQARQAIAEQVGLRVKDVDARNISVDVLAYNSKFYYVITDGGGYGESVTRLPITGNETVLDAIGQINGLPAVASKKNIWVARQQGGHEQIMPVDWNGIVQRASATTNYQIMPNDRVYVRAQKIIRADSVLAKVISPFERILGVTLLGATTVNQVRGQGQGFGNGR